MRSDEENPEPQSLQKVLAPVLLKAWPIVERIAQSFCKTEEIVKGMCQFLDHCIRVLDTSVSFLFNSLVGMIVTCYSSNPFDYLLGTAAVIVGTFGASQDLNVLNALSEMLKQITNVTFVVLGTDISSQPEIVTSYFNLLTRVIKNNIKQNKTKQKLYL
jgi:hypothetical protein